MDKLLGLLADGQFHSGEELGEQLGISRAAVWKKLKAIEALGLALDSVRGKGYRLGSGIELLDSEKIEGFLDTDVRSKSEVHTCFITDSTNELVSALGPVPAGITRFCLAEHQTKGRGRRGREWISPFGSTVSLSALWHSGEGTASLEGLSLAVGLAVLKALETLGARELTLKWPNDILWQGKKLCGVLLEVHGDPTGECEVVIGIGINVCLNDEQLELISQPAIDLFRVCGRTVSRNAVAGQLINTLTHLLNGFGRGGFRLFREQWGEYDAFLGKEVTLLASNRSVTGRYMGVDDQGGLLLETTSGLHVFKGGEVSLRQL